MSFKIGEKVVCVSTEGFRISKYQWNYPKLNKVYTIELVMHDGVVSLEEVDNSHIDRELHKRGYNILAAFWPWHFRKLSEVQKEEFEAMFEKNEKQELSTIEI
jgi:hypothetical protein